ncbi:helix-turn-helix domain-containing protein [Gordonia sp. NPDC003504]|jgi:hypothetical protein
MTLATSNADTPQAESGHDDPYRWLWLSEAEAEHYGARSTLRRYVNEGRFPTAEKVGRSWRVRKYDLDRLTRRAVPPSYDDVQAAVSAVAGQAPAFSDEQVRALSKAFTEQLARRRAVGA